MDEPLHLLGSFALLSKFCCADCGYLCNCMQCYAMWVSWGQSAHREVALGSAIKLEWDRLSVAYRLHVTAARRSEQSKNRREIIRRQPGNRVGFQPPKI